MMADEEREPQAAGSPDHPLPVALFPYLGSAPARVVGYGPCTVWRGNGAVAKIGPGAEREAHVLPGRVGSLPIATPTLITEGPGWVVMNEVANDPTRWTQRDLLAILPDLAALQDRYDAIDPSRIGALPVGTRRGVDRALDRHAV